MVEGGSDQVRSVQRTGAVEYGSKSEKRLLSAIFSNNSACVTPEQTHLPPSSPCARAVDVFATCDQQARSNPCVACGSARPPTAGPNLDTRPSYQTTTTIHPVRWPPSLPVCGARARLSPRAAHLPLSVASFEEPALSWNRPHAPPSVQGTGAVEYGSKTGNRLLSAIFSNNSACVTPEQTHLPPSSPCARAVDVVATCD